MLRYGAYVQLLCPQKNQKNMDRKNLNNSNSSAEYILPKLDLLNDYKNEKHIVSDEEIKQYCDEIYQFLSKIGIKKANITINKGPRVTTYIISSKKIGARKAEDLAFDILTILQIYLKVSVSGRIKSTEKGKIELEILNSQPSTIPLKDIIASNEFQTTDDKLPIALGTDTNGHIRFIDLANAPQILVGGTMYSGKSVFLNTVITSLLYKKSPKELQFVLINPNRYEFTEYSKLSNSFLTTLGNDTEDKIIRDTAQAKTVLHSLCKEMEERYRLMNLISADNINSYNQMFTNKQLNLEDEHRFLPYLVVIIDECSDITRQEGTQTNDTVTSIIQLAMKGKDAGIHMIITTNRICPAILPQNMKENFPTRISFKVCVTIDSVNIIGTLDASHLFSRGDMMLRYGNQIENIHGASIDSPEISRIVNFISSQF